MTTFESNSGSGSVNIQSVSSTSATPVTFKNLAGYKEHTLSITGLLTETIGITLAVDAAMANFSPKIKPFDYNTYAASAATTVSNSVVRIPSCMAIAVTKSATVDTLKLDLLSY